MRYLKYDGPMADIALLKKQHRELSEAAEKTRRREKRLYRLGTAVFWLVFLGVLAGSRFLIIRLQPESNGIVLQILDWICSLVLTLFAVILSAIAGAIAATPLWSRQLKSEKELTRELLHQSSEYLREFYGCREPYLVTKCYQSSNARFNRHDVCIYVADGELRITANLHYGFFDPRRDLGCYALTREEIALTDAQYKDRPALELRTGDLTFLLGQKARAFITNYLHNSGIGVDPQKLRNLEQRLGCRICEDGIFAEMGMTLGGYREKTTPIPGVEYGFYSGDLAPLQQAVAAVDEDWAQYFTGGSPVFCGFMDGQIVSFCIVDADDDSPLALPGVRVGSIGCVGTLPQHRGGGIGLRMVDLATVYLQQQGFHKTYISYTHIDHWYARLGYQTFARFSFQE